MEMRLILQALLIQRVQDGMAGPVSSGTGTARHRLAVIQCVSTKRALINLAFIGTRKRHAVIFQLDHRGNGITAHIFDRILVAKPV